MALEYLLNQEMNHLDIQKDKNMDTIKKTPKRKMKRITPKQEVVSKKFLYNDTKKYNDIMVIEDSCINAIDRLTLISEASIGVGNIKDYASFMENPMEALIEGYWKKYGSKYNAPNSDRMRVFFTSTGIKAMDIELYTRQYVKAVEALGDVLRPVLDGKSVTRSITKDKFDVFVSEAKNESYEATLNLIEAINKYKEILF